MKKIENITALLLMLVTATVVEAHPGLVESPHLMDSIIHFFSSADHLLTFVAVGVGLVYLVRRLGLQRNR